MFPFSPNEVVRNYLSAEQFIKACDVVWSTDRRAAIPHSRAPVPAASIVYAKVDHVSGLFEALRRRRARVVLVTSESDDTVGPEVSKPCQVSEWYSTNSRHPGVCGLPLGLANSYCHITLKASSIAGTLANPPARRGWLYVNFRTQTNPAVREPTINYFSALGSDWVTLRHADVPLDQMVQEVAAHRFALCPPGNGIDTHRMWEALYLKTIPIVLRDPALEGFRDLPILFVEKFSDLSREFLEQEYVRFEQSDWNWDKLFLPWWESRFRKSKADLNARGSSIRLHEHIKERVMSAANAVRQRLRKALHLTPCLICA